MLNIAVFVGNLRKESFNKVLAQAVEKLAASEATFHYIDVDLPLYNQDLEGNLPKKVSEAKAVIEAADGVLVVAPEYNRGIPGVLKNAMDWVSRPWGSNSFDGKPAGIIGVSSGPTGTTQAQQQLRNVLVYLNTKLLGQPGIYAQASRFFDDSGALSVAGKEQLQQYTQTFIAHVSSQK